MMYVVNTSWGIRLAVPEEEMLFFAFLRVLLEHKDISYATVVHSESFMIRKGYQFAC